MDNLMADINEAISNTDSITRGNSGEQVLLIHPDEVKKAIGKLKSGKTDGSLPLLAENLIHSSDILYGHIALLFSMMLRHGYSPHGMLVGTMIPLPKGRFNDVSNSKNFRAITISSLLDKVLDIIILIKEGKIC